MRCANTFSLAKSVAQRFPPRPLHAGLSRAGVMWRARDGCGLETWHSMAAGSEVHRCREGECSEKEAWQSLTNKDAAKRTGAE